MKLRPIRTYHEINFASRKKKLKTQTKCEKNNFKLIFLSLSLSRKKNEKTRHKWIFARNRALLHYSEEFICFMLTMMVALSQLKASSSSLILPPQLDPRNMIKECEMLWLCKEMNLSSGTNDDVHSLSIFPLNETISIADLFKFVQTVQMLTLFKIYNSLDERRNVTRCIKPSRDIGENY